MAIATLPSKLSLPQDNPGVTTVLEYLVLKFPAITSDAWQQRMADGKVHWHDGSLISVNSAFAAQQRVYYYREVDTEPAIPFAEKIIFQDELILVAYKPHFLPVTPGGEYVEECLQNRLRNKTGNQQLQAMHRIDKATAGLVLFSVEPASRQHYHNLFETHQVTKTYQAVASTNNNPPKIGQHWEIKNRLEKTGLRFLMHIVEGKPNSHSRIRCLRCSSDKALFELNPVTGKTHQLRVHMQSLGWPLLHDIYYPRLLAPVERTKPDDYSKPMQLLAQQLQFTDPVTQQIRSFSSSTELSLD
ncbi:MAG: tRNA pseudouridine32 synthase/23S rRNA pseudouridine746 synthase [Paracoccaceae bacterium]|jgi:tRNA pseudouridine32 synthase/23S rRNA pseudouridine746 synthase